MENLNILVKNTAYERPSTLINENLLCKQFLSGENTETSTQYRMCYLLCKWFRENGFPNKTQIKDKMFEWADKYNIFIRINLNDCINEVFDDNTKLSTGNRIFISQKDIDEIVSRYDSKNERLICLGIICFAKQFSNENNEFQLPLVAFGEWIGIAYNHICSRYMNDLLEYNFIEKTPAYVKTWCGTRKTSSKFKLKFEIENTGEYELVENDIKKLYDEIFSNIEYKKILPTKSTNSILSYFIYSHTNTINNKVYIGMTRQNPPAKRWGSGFGYSDNIVLSSEIKEFGWKNFKHTVLETCESKEKAIEKLSFYVKKFNSDIPEYGYNTNTDVLI